MNPPNAMFRALALLRASSQAPTGAPSSVPTDNRAAADQSTLPSMAKRVPATAAMGTIAARDVAWA
jgi:hypothetical protein